MPQENGWLLSKGAKEGFTEPSLEGLEARPGNGWDLREPKGSGWKTQGAS